MALTSDDVNFLVYRYLQESGEGYLLLPKEWQLKIACL